MVKVKQVMGERVCAFRPLVPSASEIFGALAILLGVQPPVSAGYYYQSRY